MAEETVKTPEQVKAEYNAAKTKEFLTYAGYALMFFGALYVINKVF